MLFMSQFKNHFFGLPDLKYPVLTFTCPTWAHEREHVCDKMSVVFVLMGGCRMWDSPCQKEKSSVSYSFFFFFFPKNTVFVCVSWVSERGHQTARKIQNDYEEIALIEHQHLQFCPFIGILISCWECLALNDVLQEINFRELCLTVALS